MTDKASMPLIGSPSDVQESLQAYYGIPVALRQQGNTAVKCPFCGKMHKHAEGSGHHEAKCSENVEITINNRSFVPTNYGYTIIEYVQKDGVNQILPIDQD